MNKLKCPEILFIAVILFSGSIYAQNTEDSSIIQQTNQKYIIKKDDTLWDLAFKFLGDPFKWPEIWNINAYINNPDLIYPGDPLSIPGRNSSGITSDESSNTASQSLVSYTKGALDTVSEIIDTIHTDDIMEDTIIYSSLQKNNLLSSKFFSRIPFLWTEKDVSGNIYPGNGIIEKISDKESYYLYDKFSARLLRDAKYQVGDTVDIFKSIRFVRFNGKTANLVKRTGRARITTVFYNKVEAELFEMWDVISGKERIAPKQNFPAKSIDSLIEPDIAIKGKISLRVEESVCSYPFQTLILDRGSEDGVKLGDIYAVYETVDKETKEKFSLIGCIAYLTPNSSSVIILTMSDQNVKPGFDAVLIRRSIFNEG